MQSKSIKSTYRGLLAGACFATLLVAGAASSAFGADYAPVTDAPVKVVWTREDDIRHGFYHTVTAERLEAGLDKDNKVVAWRHRSAAPSLFANFMGSAKAPRLNLRHKRGTRGRWCRRRARVRRRW